MENAKVALMFGVVVGVLWAFSVQPASSSEPQGQVVPAEGTGPARVVTQKWEYATIFVYTGNEQRGDNTYVLSLPGKDPKTINDKGDGTNDLLQVFGERGWELVTATHSQTTSASWQSARYFYFRRPL